MIETLIPGRSQYVSIESKITGIFHLKTEVQQDLSCRRFFFIYNKPGPAQVGAIPKAQK